MYEAFPCLTLTCVRGSIFRKYTSALMQKYSFYERAWEVWKVANCG